MSGHIGCEKLPIRTDTSASFLSDTTVDEWVPCLPVAERMAEQTAQMLQLRQMTERAEQMTEQAAQMLSEMEQRNAEETMECPSDLPGYAACCVSKPAG